ncbi:hypothetical protein IG631_23414 [Alternaria alternata]|nr:hypothetical protein IG631_23414 [Alternaria alternata]
MQRLTSRGSRSKKSLSVSLASMIHDIFLKLVTRLSLLQFVLLGYLSFATSSSMFFSLPSSAFLGCLRIFPKVPASLFSLRTLSFCNSLSVLEAARVCFATLVSLLR